ncbi:S8 family serine peptidase [Nocardioides sp. InS609-2]|uniref:S8 family serine peptidase n=1 Tax=Nocardioides sp. InS609-2 TaxID=2760705 RepID=UPI0020C129C6|nr:S8 family serine peptidase [Nocardioides sp. InS609-2]
MTLGTTRTTRTASRRRALRAALVPLLVATLAASTMALTSSADADDTSVTELYLVTLTEPGSAAPEAQATLAAEQDVLLSSVAAPAPVYRWTTALNGFATQLTVEQAAMLSADESVVLVEPDAILPLAAAPRTASSATSMASPAKANRRPRGGAGVVVGVIDSGIAPESPVFADTPALGREPERFAGGCSTGQDWTTDICNRKLVGARWYVDGFGVDRVRSSESLSPRDVTGHGTQVASVAAGNAGVSVAADDWSGTFGGVAPQARIAAYKACWSAPDPADDGCSTADLVTAIDAATADRVDVLNLSVAGPTAFDTVERALLGATENDIAVIAAAGNDARHQYAAHPAPWVTTVGALAGSIRAGRVSVQGGPKLEGATRAVESSGRARIALATNVAASGASQRAASQCRAGSLDASLAAGTIVVCSRGGNARVEKSQTVQHADGVGMVLVNRTRGTVADDFHSLPTVHLEARQGRVLLHWLRRHPAAEATLRPLDRPAAPPRLARWSAPGDPTAGTVKPDLVATATGVLGAVPSATGRRWDLFTGTSAAAAQVSGVAALVRARHRDWTADLVRSAIATTAVPVGRAPNGLEQGAGRSAAKVAARPGLAFPVGPSSFRDYLVGDRAGAALNTPSMLIRGHHTLTRRVTNVSSRPMYYSSRAVGFTNHRVMVQPAAMTLRPGQSTTFSVDVTGPTGPHPLDAGQVVWTSARGTTVRVPVVLVR